MKAFSKIKVFFKQFNSPLIYILIVAALISFYLGEMIDGCIIFCVILINAIVGCIQEVRADEALEALKKLSSPHSLIRRGDKIIKVLSSEVKVGDILVLEEGQVISADATIISSHGLQVDESSLTGESIRVEKSTLDKDNLNKVFESTIVVSGKAEAVVEKVGRDTEFGKISTFVKKKNNLTPLQIKLNDLSKVLGIGTIAICLFMFLISLLRKNDFLEMLITSISVAVAVIPEGLMAVVTITLSIGVQKLVNVNTITRNLSSVETLGSISLVCSDKTGTVTENKMSVKRIKTFASSKDELFRGMVFCNEATLDSGDPTEQALLIYVNEYVNLKAIQASNRRISQEAFSSEKKMMSVTLDNKATYVKGALEVVLDRCGYILDGNSIRKITLHDKKIINENASSFYEDALRVLAFSMEKDYQKIFIGLVGEKDPVRKGVYESIQILNDAGIRTVLITGDHLKTATAIAKDLNLPYQKENICLGEHIDALHDEELNKISVFARVNPLDKMKIVQRYKKNNEVVAMTGDGVNDAPSLKEADVGIAMGKNGTEVARSVADIVLTDDNFSTIEKAIETGRIIYDNIKKSIIFLLSSNLAEVLVMLLCVLLNFPLPLIAIHILWVNLISDSLPALALGGDTPLNNVMKEKPREKESTIFSNGGTKYTIIYGVVICITTFIAFFLIPTIEIIQSGSFNISTYYQDLLCQFKNEYILRKSRTLAFTVLGLSELFHMIGMSDVKSSIWSILKKKNYLMWIVLILGIALQVIVTEVPFFEMLFKTESLCLSEWIWLILLSMAPLVVHECIRS